MQTITFREKISFAMVNFGHTLLSIVISTYILYYYTDVLLLPAAAVSFLLFSVRIFDGAVDPFIGFFMDRHQTKNGKYLGYVKYFTLPLCLFSILLFFPGINQFTKPLLNCYIIYYLWSFSFSMVESASLALSVSITEKTYDRQVLNTYKVTASIIATLIVSYGTLHIVDFLGRGNELNGYFYTIVLIAFLGLIFLFWGTSGIRERSYRAPNTLYIRESIAILGKNKKFFFFILMYFLHQIASSLKTQSAIYYFKYSFNRLDLVPIFMLLSRMGSLAAQPLIVLLSKKYPIEKIMFAGYLIAGISIALVTFSEFSVFFMMFLCILSSIGSAFPANLSFTYLGSLSDGFAEENDNLCFGAISSTLLALSSKFGIAIAGAVIALILSLSTYQPGAVQSDGSLLAIKICFTGLSSIMYLLSGFSIMLSHRQAAK